MNDTPQVPATAQGLATEIKTAFRYGGAAGAPRIEAALLAVDQLVALASEAQGARSAEAGAMQLAPAEAMWFGCFFNGPPPAGYGSWHAWVNSPVKSGATIRATSDHPQVAAVVPKAQAEAAELTDDAIWKNDALMSINAELGLPMDRFGPVVRAIAAALSTPAPQAREPAEPVAWMMRWTGHAPSVTTDPSDYPTERDQGLLIPLYAAPSQAEPAQPHPCSLSATGDSNG